MKRRSRTSGPPEPTFFVDRDLAGKRFLAILRAAGLRIVDHNDIFGPETTDPEWLEYVGKHEMVALTRDRLGRSSYETRKLMEANARVFVLIGSVPFHELAETFIATMARTCRFLKRNKGPFIAKISRPNERDRSFGRPGRVRMWISHEDWLRREIQES